MRNVKLNVLISETIDRKTINVNIEEIDNNKIEISLFPNCYYFNFNEFVKPVIFKKLKDVLDNEFNENIVLKLYPNLQDYYEDKDAITE